MTVVAAAVIGSAVVGGVVANSAANTAADASREGSANAAQATIESTQMQIDEIARQFDYQTRILGPQIQQQFNAQQAYSDILGIGGPAYGANAETGFQPTARDMDTQNARRQEEIGIYEDYMNRPGVGPEERASYQAAIDQVNARQYDQEMIDASAAARGPTAGGPGSSGPARNPGDFRDPETGAFVDPNLDPTRLADDTAYRQSVEGNLMGAESIGDDAYNNYLRENAIASGAIEDDTMVRRTNDVRLAEGAAGQGVYGETFQEGPGYAFAREEMGRELDRKNSAGGNYGGRAIMEAQRRAKGLADQEFYNWAGGRERDLGRLSDAERVDIQRGDSAYAGYENQRIADISRQDAGYQDYLRRQELDASRLDAAGSQEDALRATDQQRQDQAYYNYLDSLGRAAQYGGGAAAQAVDASQAAGAATSGAYGSQGRQLSENYANEGASQANIGYARGAGINNAIQGGIEGFVAGGDYLGGVGAGGF